MLQVTRELQLVAVVKPSTANVQEVFRTGLIRVSFPLTKLLVCGSNNIMAGKFALNQQWLETVGEREHLFLPNQLTSVDSPNPTRRKEHTD